MKIRVILLGIISGTISRLRLYKYVPYNLSTHIAIPMPPPIHNAATPRLLFVLINECIKVTNIRHPDAPRG